ncbi:MAG: hypothetical protein AAGB51_12910 [Planctomycetota bacterium]
MEPRPEQHPDRPASPFGTFASGLLLAVVLSVGMGMPSEAFAAMAGGPSVRADLRAVTDAVVRAMRAAGKKTEAGQAAPAGLSRMALVASLLPDVSSSCAAPPPPMPHWTLLDLPPPVGG